MGRPSSSQPVELDDQFGRHVPPIVDSFTYPVSFSHPASLDSQPLSTQRVEECYIRKANAMPSRICHDRQLNEKPNYSSKTWCPNRNPLKALHVVPVTDTESLRRVRQPGAKLCTVEIDRAMNICRELFPSIPQRMQDPIRLPNGKFVQILNIGDHFITVSNVFSPPGCLKVYDSAYCRERYKIQQLEQISRLVFPHIYCLEVTVGSVQQQSLKSNLCGHFSIAFAYALCKGIKPEQVKVKETTIRGGVADVMEAHMRKQDVKFNFGPRAEPAPCQEEPLVVYLCRHCKQACEEQCCPFCQKSFHEKCRWFINVPPVGQSQHDKKLRCKLCRM